MIVPAYWAEARRQQRKDGRQITVRRYGWSDASQADAQQHAETRAGEALQRLLTGEKLARREPKQPYNGADGLPIREEIVERHGTAVVTRNSYGARCLNVPDVLFADIDHAHRAPLRLSVIVFVLAALAAALAGHACGSGFGYALAFAAVLGCAPAAHGLFRLWRWLAGGAEAQELRRVRRYAHRHPDWGIRVYRTPAGLRLLVTHRPFAPDATEVAAFFAAVGTDPLYARMCRNQRCFRARVSAKPWRIGIGAHLKPRPGVWPVAAEKQLQRAAWIAAYERAAEAWAACTSLEHLGPAAIHPAVAPVLALHDRLSRAGSKLPIA